MKPIVIYQSKTENTKLIAHTISKTLEADIVAVENVTAQDLRNRTLVGFGSGIYWTRVDEQIYKTAASLPEDCKVFMFITSGLGFPFLIQLYWHFIKIRFDQLGIQLAGKWDCRGYDKHPLSKWMGLSRSHPDSQDIETARQFALELNKFK